MKKVKVTKATIEDIEKILNDPGHVSIHINPDGSIRAQRAKDATSVGNYKVVEDDGGCVHCGHGQMWTVMGPDEICIGQAFEDREAADDLADFMNQAYLAGVKDGSEREAL